MKNYSSITKASSRQTSNRRISILLGIGVLLLSLFFVGAFVVRPVVELVTTPVLYVQSWIRSSDAVIPSLLRDRSALTNQIAELRQSLMESSYDDEEISRLRAENDSLRTLLGEDEDKRVLAKVIAKPGMVPYDTMVIDAGSNEGITEHAPVFIGDSVVIGYVQKVFPETSVVLLVTSPGLESTAYVLGPNIYATAVGQGGGVLRLGVPQGIELSEGNVVIVPTLSGAMFGEVVAVESESARPEQYGFVTLEEALSTVYMVSVGTRPITPQSFSEVQEIIANTERRLLTTDVPVDMLLGTATTSSSTASTTEELEEDVSGAPQNTATDDANESA